MSQSAPLFLDWGLVDYAEALERQKKLLADRQANLISDTYVFCEHPAVITVGRGKPKPGELPYIPQPGIAEVSVERGGLATYHGPGQLVCYPFVRLSPPNERDYPGGIVCFIRFLETWIIDTLQSFAVNAKIIEGKTGVWTHGQPPEKLASIGIAVSHWVTYHGLALNFATGKEVWRQFNPCGMDGNIMTDMKLQSTAAEANLNYENIKRRLQEQFAASRQSWLQSRK